MKKTILISAVVALAVVIFGAGFMFAQSSLVQAAGLPHGFGPGGMVADGGMMGGRGAIHDYVEKALIAKLGLTQAEYDAAEQSGKSMQQIAIDAGTKEADVTALLTDVHKTALAAAVKDGVLTQAQADAMLTNITANGFTGCGGTYGGRGGRGGRDGMHGGMMGGWNQQAQPTVAP